MNFIFNSILLPILHLFHWKYTGIVSNIPINSNFVRKTLWNCDEKSVFWPSTFWSLYWVIRLSLLLIVTFPLFKTTKINSMKIEIAAMRTAGSEWNVILIQNFILKWSLWLLLEFNFSRNWNEKVIFRCFMETFFLSWKFLLSWQTENVYI